MSDQIISKNGVRIRLTDERWSHIIAEHGELADMQKLVLATVADPERIVEGRQGEMLAVRTVESGKFMVVVYREMEGDGFIITAFMTRGANSLDRRKQLWP